MKKIVIVSVVLLFLTCSPVLGSTFTEQLNGLRGLVNQWILPEDRAGYLEFIDWLQENHTVLSSATTEITLEAFLTEVITDSLEEEDEDAIDAFIGYIDGMRADLFFETTDLVPIRTEIYSGSTLGCTCVIFTRQVGPLTFDPGGLLYSQMAHAVELEARLIDDLFGGPATFEWEVSAPNAITQDNNGPRVYLRLLELESVNVGVTCQTEMGKCQDVLRIIAQGGFPAD